MARIASIDTLRVAAILGVLTLHSRVFRGPDELTSWERGAEAILDHAARFGVPFFFFVSGYLLGLGQARDGNALGRAAASFRRLIFLYVSWSVILIAWELGERAVRSQLSAEPLPWPPDVKGADLVGRAGVGIRMHLWFLPALAQALLVVGVAGRFGPRIAIAIGAGLYGIGLAGGAYAPLTGFNLGMLSRNGPFFGTLFAAAGFAAAVRGWRPTLAQAILVTSVGALAHAGEVLARREFAGLPVLDERVNYLCGTSLFGIGVGLVALAAPRLGTGTAWPRWGALTLGIYAVHVKVQQGLADVSPFGGIAGQLFLIVAGYALSLMFVAALVQTGVGRRLVS